MSKRKIGLVVLYNHNYEKNIEKIRCIYRERFPEMRQLMPFYYGNDPEVIRVYGNSFYFQTYIAQAREKLLQMDCSDFLIIGDDLLLNPEITAENFHEKMGAEPGSFYMDGVVDVSSGLCWRAAVEAHKFNMYFPGLDGSANRIVPTYEEAEKRLHELGVMETTSLKRYQPFYPKWEHPICSNLSVNYRLFKSRVYHFLKMLDYRFSSRKMSYPCVFGYSDIVLVPRERMVDFCRYLEVFATWRMFVELAIPTAIMLLPDAKCQFADSCRYKTGNVWYPQDPAHFKAINGLIEEMTMKAEGRIGQLKEAFPHGYAYLHPVKLSKFKRD